jgi:hypothetical protein
MPLFQNSPGPMHPPTTCCACPLWCCVVMPSCG